MTREAIDELKKYTLGKENTEKVAISVLQLKRIIKALEQEPEIVRFANLETTELFDVLQRVYRCPSELLDRNDALDAIMTVYAQYLKAKGQT